MVIQQPPAANSESFSWLSTLRSNRAQWQIEKASHKTLLHCMLTGPFLTLVVAFEEEKKVMTKADGKRRKT